MARWKMIEVEGQFQIDVPKEASHRLEDDAIVIRFPGSKGTDLWIARYPVDSGNARFKATCKRLEHQVWVFLSSSVAKTVGSVPGICIEPAVEAEPDLLIVQGVGIVNNGSSWIVRAVAKRGWNEYFLLHWNGPEEVLGSSVILRSLISFAPV